MFIHNPIITDSTLDSVTTHNGRYYKSPTTNLWYPSVTTVTGFKQKDFFVEWRKKPENKKYALSAANRGTQLHSMIESYIQNKSDYSVGVTYECKDLFSQIKPNLDLINNVLIQEQSLWSDKFKIAGRLDLAAEFKGKLSVIDFKSSSKEKKEEWIQHYFEQATCYALMIHERFDINIEQIVIMIANTDGNEQTFVKNVTDYKKSLNETIENYWKHHNFDEIQASVLESLK